MGHDHQQHLQPQQQNRNNPITRPRRSVCETLSAPPVAIVIDSSTNSRRHSTLSYLGVNFFK